MEETEDSGDKDMAINKKPISPEHMDNNHSMQKRLNSTKSSIEKESNGVKKSYANDNGSHDGDNISYVNGVGKKLLNNTDGRCVVDELEGDKTFVNGNCKKISEGKRNSTKLSQHSVTIGDTLEQYTSTIDETLENLEQCKTEVSNKLSNHSKSRSNKNGTKNENGIKNENETKNENGVRNEKGCINNGSINNGSINNGSINNGSINNGSINRGSNNDINNGGINGSSNNGSINNGNINGSSNNGNINNGSINGSSNNDNINNGNINGSSNNGSINNGSINNGSINNGSINNGSINNEFGNGPNEDFFPLVSLDDDEMFSTIPDATEDEDMLIQEKIMQSKSELVSKLNSQKGRNLVINNEDDITNGHNSISDMPMTSEIATSSQEAINGGSKELTLFEACRQGHYEKVKELLTSNSNVDVNMTDGDCWSCLHETSIRNCQFTPITELLLQNGANANLKDKKGETPLHGAVLFHLVDTIKLLLEYKADFNICNNQKVSPLKLATYLKDNEILLLFGEAISEDKIVKKKKKKRKRNSHKDFTLPISTSPSILKKRRTSDESSSSTTPHSKKRINFSL